ncbi:MAG: 1-deoxy-D-xylulose-5-phosphate synthase [Alphaproteobacteria bacterium]|nr:1-deoxy-D-xylulose-5-phosphate synthase [Alphaproteobacteria bacterium]
MSEIVPLTEAILPKLKSPVDLRQLPMVDLPKLASEIRNEIVDVVSKNGGHLASSLGVVELTIALHYVFNTPDDKLIWDVGHQCYAHKLLTGRQSGFKRLRQEGGLSGFTKRTESEFDPFGAGHSSTSVSAAVGMAAGRDLQKRKNNVIAVIGDGSMSAGMAFEALNNAGDTNRRMIVILNDNDMSIAQPVGALSHHLSQILSSKQVLNLRQIALDMSDKLPQFIKKMALKVEQHAKGLVTNGTLFEELGLYYIGPIDGHNFEQLIPILSNIRDVQDNYPILLHVVTQKGRGYVPAEVMPSKYHGVSKFDIETGDFIKKKDNRPTFTQAFSDTIVKLAKNDDKISTITAAMPSGTGLDEFSKKYPERFFDVGIAEQHAVTFAAGLACEGVKPFVALYSSFFQRAYDQMMHDVALQNLPVRFVIDRAGFVGDDGATHNGVFDLTMMCPMPNMIVMSPSDQNELQRMIATMANINDHPSAIRFPRGAGVSDKLLTEIEPIEIGKGRIVHVGMKYAILSLGSRLEDCQKAAEILEKEHNISVTVADARFAKPFDKDLIKDLAKKHKGLVIVEEGVCGGFGSMVLSWMANEGMLNKLSVRTLGVPDSFIEHATQQRQCEISKIDSKGIVEAVLSLK